MGRTAICGGAGNACTPTYGSLTYLDGLFAVQSYHTILEGLIEIFRILIGDSTRESLISSKILNLDKGIDDLNQSILPIPIFSS